MMVVPAALVQGARAEVHRLQQQRNGRRYRSRCPTFLPHTLAKFSVLAFTSAPQWGLNNAE